MPGITQFSAVQARARPGGAILEFVPNARVSAVFTLFTNAAKYKDDEFEALVRAALLS